MAKFTLFESPLPGDEEPDPATNPSRKPGDYLLIIERVLVDRKGRQRGTMTVRGTILRTFKRPDDVLWALQSHYKLQKGVINSHSVFRFNDLHSANGVTFAIVGGTGKFKKAHGTVTPRRVGPNRVEVTFRVS